MAGFSGALVLTLRVRTSLWSGPALLVGIPHKAIHARSGPDKPFESPPCHPLKLTFPQSQANNNHIHTRCG